MNAIIKGTEVKTYRGNTYTIMLVQSDSNPDKLYRVDVVGQRCDCPGWKFQRAGVDGKRQPCKHLRALGFRQTAPVAKKSYEALPGVVGTKVTPAQAEAI